MGKPSLRVYVLTVGIGSTFLIGICAFICLYFSNKKIEEYQALIEHDMARSFAIESAVSDYKKQVQEWKNVLLRGHNPKDLDKYWQRFLALQASLQDTSQKMIRDERIDSVKVLLEGFRQSHGAALESYRNGKKAYENDGFNPSTGDQFVRGIDREPTEKLEAAAEEILQTANKMATQLADESKTLFSTLALMMLAALALVSGLAWYISMYRISRPVTEMVEKIKGLDSGSYDQHISEQSCAELSDMAHCISQLQNKLKGFVGRMSTALMELKDSDDMLNQTSERIHAGTQSQHQRTDLAAAAMVELSSTAVEVEKQANDAANASGHASEQAVEGRRVMDTAIEAMSNMKAQVADTASIMQVLEENVESVGKVLEVIRGVAEQTNLLALNAAIEAARAGEQGRGFAVVADEVRTLAQRTEESTAEIHQIINNVQSSAQNAAAAISSGVSTSEQSVRNLNEAGQSLDSIREQVKEISDTNRRIVLAANEQAKVSSEMSETISDVASTASESASQADTVMSAAGRIKSIREDFDVIMRQLAESR